MSIKNEQKENKNNKKYRYEQRSCNKQSIWCNDSRLTMVISKQLYYEMNKNWVYKHEHSIFSVSIEIAR